MKRFDLIFLSFGESCKKPFYILVCDGTNSYVDPMLLGTYCITDARHELFLDCSTSTTFLVCSTPVISCIARHLLYIVFLSTWMFLDHSASKHSWVTRHILCSNFLGMNFDSAPIEILTQHTFCTRHTWWKWLSVLTLNCQNHSFDQQSPPLTWVSKTLN